MKNLSVLSIILLILISSSQLLAMQDESWDPESEAHRIMEEALAQQRQAQAEATTLAIEPEVAAARAQARETSTSMPPAAASQAEASLPSSDNQSRFNPRSGIDFENLGLPPEFQFHHAPGCSHARVRMGLDDLFESLPNDLEQALAPYKALRKNVTAADTTMRTVLVTYLALSKEDQEAIEKPSVTPESLSRFIKEKEEFVNAGDSLYECLGNPRLKEFMKAYYINHPAMHRFIDRVDTAASQVTRSNLPREPQLRLHTEVLALQKGLKKVSDIQQP